MDELVNVVGKLREVFSIVGSPDGLDLPEIIVVGTQSSGKSSVIESIVGRDFLPRGTGIVTRRPLALQLVQVPKTDAEEQEWATFLHLPGKEFTNFDEVRKEIEAETARALPEKEKCISSSPINLKIFSPHVAPLSLVDLPGTTKVPVGNQPTNIEQIIEEMILEHISNPNAIILAITAANTDLGTSESLKLARKVDPEGLRTLGVLTKLDLMDKGTNATEVLTGKVIHVKRGIIGVVNRSQADIQNGKPIEEARRDEELFFRREYPALAHVNGTVYLAQTLSCLLSSHVQDTLPSLQGRIYEQRAKYQSMLNYCDSPISDENKADALLTRIVRFVKVYGTAVSGSNEHVEIGDICAGAKICQIFHETYAQELQHIAPLGGLAMFNVLAAIRNATGPMPALGAQQMSFAALARYQIKRFEEPSSRCVDLVYGEMQGISQYCASQLQEDVRHFPQLYARIAEIMSSLLDKQLPVTKQEVAKMVAMETAYINVKHPDFKEAVAVYLSAQGATSTKPSGVGKHAADALVSLAVESMPVTAVFQLLEGAIEREFNQTTEEMGSCSRIEKLLDAYVMIVRKIIQDAVPKVIMRDFVNHILNNMQRELTLELHKPELLLALMKEAEPIERCRQDATSMLEALQKAGKVIADVEFSCMTINNAEQQKQHKQQQQLQLQQQLRQQQLRLQEEQAKRNQKQPKQQEEAKQVQQHQPPIQLPQHDQLDQGSDVDFPPK